MPDPLSPLVPPTAPDMSLPWGIFMAHLQEAYSEMRALAFRRDCERFGGMPDNRYCLPDPSAHESVCDIAACDRWFSQQVARWHVAPA